MAGLWATFEGRAQSQTVGQMSIGQARQAVMDAIQALDNRDPAVQIKLTESSIQTTLKGFVMQYRFRDTPNVYLEECGFFSNCQTKVRVFTKSGGPNARPECCNWIWAGQNKRLAEGFVVGFRRLAIGANESPEEAARFAEEAKTFREASPRPQLPEEARRFRVRAESAVSEKRFDDAAEGYEQALRIAPWWPEGRFNRALVLSETERYNEAIKEMKRYLTLVPDAPNARAAQDLIYAWEDKAARQ